MKLVRTMMARGCLLAAGFGALLPAPARAAILSGTYTVVPAGSEVNLSAQGPVDWVHWGLNTEFGLDRKASVPARIAVTALIPGGGEGPYQYADNFNGYSWSDGTPNTFATNTLTGVYAVGKNS